MKNNIITLIPKITNTLVQFTGTDMINSDDVYAQVLCVMYMVFLHEMIRWFSEMIQKLIRCINLTNNASTH